MTTTDTRDAHARLLPKVALALCLVAGGLAVVGYWPTRVWAGEGGVQAMWLGVGCALAASLAGMLPVLWTLGSEPRYRVAGALGATAARLVVMLTLLLVLLIGRTTPRLPLALWAVGAYLLLLVVDTVLVSTLSRRMESSSR